MVISSNVLNLSEQAAGRFRCTFNYVLDDGREINIKPSMVNADYQAVCDARATSVFESVVKSDAKKAFSLGIKDAYGYATKGQVFFEYLESAYYNPDPIESYNGIKDVVEEIQRLGLSVEQAAGLMGMTQAQTQAVVNRYQLLNSNLATLTAYETLKGQL